MMKKVLCLALILSMASFAMAIRTAWDGDTSTDYFDAANWGDGVPVAGDGCKMTDSFITPTYMPTLVNGSATCAWMEVSHGVTLTIGQDGVFTVTGAGDSPSMGIVAPQLLPTLNLVDNGSIITTGLWAAWSGDAAINMSGTSTWLADGGVFMLGKWDDDNNPGIAHMTMSGDSLLTVTGGDFRIKGNVPGYTAYKSSLTMADNAMVVIYGDITGKIQGYIDDGLLINAQVALDGQDNTVITFIPEPATMLLLGLGGLALIRKKR